MLITVGLALDRIAKMWSAGWTYVWFAIGKCPHLDETYSGCFGYYAEKGHHWALICEEAVDLLFGAGHCRAAARREEARRAATQEARQLHS